MQHNTQYWKAKIQNLPASLLKSFPENEKNIFKNYKFIPIELLIEADWNYKENDEYLQGQLENNIKRNGQIATCNVRELPTGYYEVIDGNHRLKSFKNLGQSFVVCYDHGVISLADAKRIAIEKNETRFESNEGKLNEIMSELFSTINATDLRNTLPFPEDELNSIIDGLGDSFQEAFDAIEDSVSEDSDSPIRNNFDENLIDEDNCDIPIPTEPKTKLGDIYELNGHRFICGDSTDETTVSKLMQGEKAHLLYTDPPYNVNYAEFNKNRNAVGKDWTEDYCSDWDDSMSDEAYKKFLKDFLRLAKANLIEWGHYYVWHATTFMQEVLDAFKANDIPYDKVPIQWVKQVAPPSRVRYWRKSEPCIFGGKGAVNGNGKGSRWFGKIGEVNIWVIAREHNCKYIHPTQKPLPLSARAINNSTQEGDTVLDMFLGSGSTLISCDIMNRKCRGLELEPKFADMIVLRFMKYCRDRNKECVVKVNGEVIDRSYFNYKDEEVRTVDTYEFTEE